MKATQLRIKYECREHLASLMRPAQHTSIHSPTWLYESCSQHLIVSCFSRVEAAGINRADLVQREGNYPVPPGAPSWQETHALEARADL